MTECYRILQTEEFEEWLSEETALSRYQIDTRLAKLRLDGYFGKINNVSKKEKGILKIKYGNSNSMTEGVYIMPIFQS